MTNLKDTIQIFFTPRLKFEAGYYPSIVGR